MRVSLAAIYGFAVEGLYHPTYEKHFYRRFGKHRKSDVSPHKLCPQKIAFELWFGFENLEFCTLQALWERFTDLLFDMGKHFGHNETIKSQMPGEIQFVPHLNPHEPL